MELNAMHIATATLLDVPALSGLLSELFSQETEFTSNPDAQSRGLSLIITNPELGTVLVAKDDSAILGMVNILFTVSTALGGRVAILEDMIVSAHARRAGIGGRLLEQAINVARAAGCKRITLLTDQANESAQRFYGRYGFLLSPMIPLRLALT
jgi:GNAT superfamily N-acetyltransferase